MNKKSKLHLKISLMSLKSFYDDSKPLGYTTIDISKLNDDNILHDNQNMREHEKDLGNDNILKCSV